jgi:hypothetical protein
MNHKQGDSPVPGLIPGQMKLDAVPFKGKHPCADLRRKAGCRLPILLPDAGSKPGAGNQRQY